MTQLSTWQPKLTPTTAPSAVILIRFYVGAIFLSEGILKFVRPEEQGTGRFDKAGIPAPGFFAPSMGSSRSSAGC